MNRQSARRTILGTIAAGAGAIVLAAEGGGLTAAARTSRQDSAAGGTPVASVSPREELEMDAQASKELWGRWLELWNGDFAIADELIAPDFVAHFAPAGNSPTEVRGPEGLTSWIGGATAAFRDHEFATIVGPIVDGDMIAGRWVFRGTYQGGFPGASPEAVGTLVEYEGTDIIRIEDGQIVEYWLSADILDLLQQVGVIPS